MNVRNLSDAELLGSAKKWAAIERQAATEILHHLAEIERRRLYCDLKCSSLFDYAMRELKYSESQALRRIGAMRMLRSAPHIEPQLQSGELTLTNAAMAYSVFQKESFTEEGRVETLRQLVGKTTREAEKILNRRREVTYDAFDDDLRGKLLAVRGRWAHKESSPTLVQLLHLFCDRELEELPVSHRLRSRAPFPDRLEDLKCSNCGSVHALEVDRIRPRALGGSDEPSNLRILCRNCNQRAAIRVFGASKMEKFLRPARP